MVYFLHIWELIHPPNNFKNSFWRQQCSNPSNCWCFRLRNLLFLLIKNCKIIHFLKLMKRKVSHTFISFSIFECIFSVDDMKVFCFVFVRTKADTVKNASKCCRGLSQTSGRLDEWGVGLLFLLFYGLGCHVCTWSNELRL